MNKFKVFIFDLFFVISSVIGVGFATGKEIEHFFLGGKSIVIAVVVFCVVFVALSIYLLHIKNKHNIDTLSKLNKFAFGKHYEIGNIVLFVMFIVTSAAMLAGCDNLAKNYLAINLPIVSIFLSIITFFIVIGGINRIKIIANVITPILIVAIIINTCFNMKTGSCLNGNISIDIIYPIIFCSENFITVISVLLTTKSKPKHLSLASGIVISILVLVSALAIKNISADMPMLALSKNVGNMFFAGYLLSVIFAIFTTLEISTYYCLQLANKNYTQKYFALLLIIITSQIIAYLGFNFIVKYLYTGVGIMSAIYLIALIIKLIINKNK